MLNSVKGFITKASCKNRKHASTIVAGPALLMPRHLVCIPLRRASALVSSDPGGIIGGLLGSGSGFILRSLILEIGVIPQVASATTTFVMTFLSFFPVFEFYIFNIFPIPYALYLNTMSILAGFWGQLFVR
ncbi:hypothetical protein TSUD_02480 [Trifolium subterraneum]|uniref:Uncharacterized protein n=1 Tax=Trifolium subterraneum TaxID=3900 RepID=A0A2Z6M4J5_TRISU|nr:hypothetical protein TSUD_02480 [Trifolium subterraneum]